MKLGVSSYSFSQYMSKTNCDYLHICNKAKEIGFEGIEFIDLNSESPLKTAREIRKHCDEIGLEIIAYTVGADLLNCDAEQEINRLKGCIDICEALGAKILRHDLCYGTNTDGSFDYDGAIAKMTPAIREITEYAKSKGIRTCSENHGFIFQAPQYVKALIENVANENYGWLCDMGNFLCADADPLESVKIASKYAFHIHAKDFYFYSKDSDTKGGIVTNGGNSISGTVVGRGIVPVKECIEIFKNAGYNGWLSLEFEGSEDCLEAINEGYEFLKKNI